VHTNPAQLYELAVFRPCVGLGDEQHQIAILLRPDVDGEVTVTDRHGVVLIAAKFMPGNIVSGGVAVVNGGRRWDGCKGRGYSKGKEAEQNAGAGSAAGCGFV
jgi:hypothetical protein